MKGRIRNFLQRVFFPSFPVSTRRLTSWSVIYRLRKVMQVHKNSQNAKIQQEPDFLMYVFFTSKFSSPIRIPNALLRPVGDGGLVCFPLFSASSSCKIVTESWPHLL